MAKGGSGYLGFSWIVSLILAIFFITNIILGIVIRVQKGKLLLAILNFFLAPIFYVVDLVSIIMNKSLKWLV